MRNFSTESFLKHSIIFIFVFSIISCGGSTHYLLSGSFSKKDTYQFNSYYGCCGCNANYFLLKQGKRKIEQIVYSYNCPPGGNVPTKFIFNYDFKGRLTDCDKYIGTIGNDFTIAVNSYEKRLFEILDSTSWLKKNNNYSYKYSQIKGFRKAYMSEATHGFPLIKNGAKLSIK